MSSVCDLYIEEALLGMQVLKFEIYVLFQDRENIRRQQNGGVGQRELEIVVTSGYALHPPHPPPSFCMLHTGGKGIHLITVDTS